MPSLLLNALLCSWLRATVMNRARRFDSQNLSIIRQRRVTCCSRGFVILPSRVTCCSRGPGLGIFLRSKFTQGVQKAEEGGGGSSNNGGTTQGEDESQGDSGRGSKGSQSQVNEAFSSQGRGRQGKQWETITGF